MVDAQGMLDWGRRMVLANQDLLSGQSSHHLTGTPSRLNLFYWSCPQPFGAKNLCPFSWSGGRGERALLFAIQNGSLHKTIWLSMSSLGWELHRHLSFVFSFFKAGLSRRTERHPCLAQFPALSVMLAEWVNEEMNESTIVNILCEHRPEAPITSFSALDVSLPHLHN